MMRNIGDHAVVLGASMSGLLAARVLANAYQRVTAVDRDPLPEHGADCKGCRRAGTRMRCCPAARRSSTNCSRGCWPAWRRPGYRSFTITASCGSQRVGTCCAGPRP
jgi:glycine/D-amino acid oxidase-like deaminating enzyme